MNAFGKMLDGSKSYSDKAGMMVLCLFSGLSVSPAPCWNDRCADDVIRKGDRAGGSSDGRTVVGGDSL